MAGNLWTSPTGAGANQLYEWAKRLTQLLTQEKYKDYHVKSVTLTAGTTTAVAWSGMGSDHNVFITPKNSAAAALSPYVSARTAGTGFTLTHGAAGGTETFDCLIIR